MSNIIRVIAVAGLACTGTTTIAQHVAASLGWRLTVAGDRFRARSSALGIPLHDLPREVHFELDELIRNELRDSSQTVFDGRYLGLFARDCRDILRVLVQSSLQAREQRSSARAAQRGTVNDSLMVRDMAEARTALDLYGNGDFLDPSLFDLVLSNDSPEDLSYCVDTVLKAARNEV